MTLTVLHSTADATSGKTFWRVIFGLWLVKFLLDPLHLLADMPAMSLFPLPGILRLCPPAYRDMLLSPAVLWGLRVSGCVIAAACIWKPTNWKLGLVGCGVFVLYQSLVRWYGHINHAEIPLVLATLLLVAMAMMDKPNGVAISAVTFGFLLSYSFIAIFRFVRYAESLFRGTESIFGSDSLIVWSITHAYKTHGVNVDGGYWLMDMPSWIGLPLRLSFVFVTLVELLAPLAMVQTFWRWMTFVVLFGFHVGCLVMFDILFWEDIAMLCLLVGFDWGQAKGNISDERRPLPNKQVAASRNV